MSDQQYGCGKTTCNETLTDMAPFGTERSAMEELAAEMGSGFLCHFSRIQPNEIKSKVTYLDTWLSIFKKDKRFLITAAGQAQKAVNLVLYAREQKSNDDNRVIINYLIESKSSCLNNDSQFKLL